MESIYALHLGHIVVTPATVGDAYTMVIDAIAIDDPVIYCEQKYLYFPLEADEVDARVAAARFHLLDEAPARLNCKDTPIPYHPNLWSEHRPGSKAIAAKARQVLNE